MAQFQYHLDNIYNRRWQKFHLADGSYKDSRELHWRQVAWENVVKLEVQVRDYLHEVLPGPAHKGFITYRTSGIEWVDGEPGKKRIPRGARSWYIGWLNETHAHVKQIDFQTGFVKTEEVIPIERVEAHIHPRLKQQWERNWNEKIKGTRAAQVTDDQGHL